jgi:Carbamate kinase
MAMTSPLMVVAIGGNALIKDKQHQSVPDQMAALEETSHHLAALVEDGWRMVIGHGNGPQVGFILRRSELARTSCTRCRSIRAMPTRRARSAT